MSRFRARVIVGSLCLAGGCAAGTSDAPVITLATPVGSLDAEFSAVLSMRELQDGRVLVTDRREGQLLVVDFANNTVQGVGAKGSGPKEYRSVNVLEALRGDTTSMDDNGNDRALLLVGATIIADRRRELSMPFSPMYAEIVGRDDSGRIVGTIAIGGMTKEARPLGDSVLLVRRRRADSGSDTVTRLATGKYSTMAITGGAPDVVLEEMADDDKPIPFYVASADVAMVFPDGWIAVARFSPHRVDWFSPNGESVRGPVLPSGHRLSDADKRAHLAREAVLWGIAPRPVEKITGWPEVAPPFLGRDEMFAAPDGRLLILRMADANRPGKRYDVIDRKGNLAATVVIPESARIHYFGKKFVYLITTDDDGIERIERRPWP